MENKSNEQLEEFSWEVTSENPQEEPNGEQIDIHEEFDKNFKTFSGIISGLKPTEIKEKNEFIRHFYDNVEPIIWNEMFSEFFKTKKDKNPAKFVKIKDSILDYSIIHDPNLSLADIKFKTSSIENYQSWKIEEDLEFANVKPELLDFVGSKTFCVKAKVAREVLKIPFNEILDTLIRMDKKYIGIVEYLFNSILTEPKTLKEIRKDGLKYLKENPDILLYNLCYRNSPEFGMGYIWNAIITNSIKMRDIAYFTLSKGLNIVGNFWVHPSFRNNKIASKIFDYLITKELPKRNSFIIQTKNPLMEKLIKKQENSEKNIKVFEIGRATCYESEKYPYATKEKEALDYNEKTFVIFKNELMQDCYKNIFDFIMTNSPFMLSSTFLGHLYQKFEIPKTGSYNYLKLFEVIVYGKEDENIIKLNETKDKDSLPKFYNAYKNEWVSHPGQILKIDNDHYFLPKFDGNWYIPYTEDIRGLLIRLENKVSYFDTKKEFIIVLNNDPEKEVYIYNKEQFPNLNMDILKWLFDHKTFGIEYLISPIKNQCNKVEINYDNLEINFIIDNLVTKKDIIEYYYMENNILV